ncbi:CapA family protein [uncultured Desulfobacter sp.]|uniref:CapA family protein n=1 Tax=uncultured Desulfobacter sp. TaxID=240139 RepID=UPI0029C75C4F|nr:CapA family protein [uncultured Desulfobacter sp.]
MPATNRFNFRTGSWSGDTGPTDAATLIIAGDWAPIRAFAPLIESDPQSIYGDVLPLLREADLSLVNLEAPLSDIGNEVSKSGAVFKGKPSHIKGLTAVPFSAVTLGNNHMFDFGVEAFRQTAEVLDRHAIACTGAGMNKEDAESPLIMEAKGLCVAILNISEGEDLTAAGHGPGVAGWDIKGACARIKNLKKNTTQVLHAVIAVAHCGLEYIPFAPEYVTNAFRELAHAGADAVIGHHPHVPQGLFFHGKTPVCCSLGNFIFYQHTNLFWRKLGYMVRLHISKKGLAGLDIEPYRIHDRGVQMLTGPDRDYFFKRFKEISEPLSTPQGSREAWQGFLDYYGVAGLKNEVNMILNKLDDTPGKGAAMFRNRLTTAQHFYHWQDLLTRVVQDKMGQSPVWARELAREWLTRQIQNER